MNTLEISVVNLEYSVRLLTTLVHTLSSWLVSYPVPNPRTGKGLVTLEQFLGCTGV